MTTTRFCKHETINTTKDYMGPYWTAYCYDCADGEMSGPTGQGLTRLAAFTNFWQELEADGYAED